MIKKSDYFKIGEIRKTHGVKGEMMLMSDLPIPLEKTSEWLFFNLEECLVPFKLETFRHTADSTVLFLCKSITSVEAAAEYVGKEIYLPLSEKIENADMETPTSLIGFTVIIEEDNKELGKIVDFIDSNFNPLLEIEHQGENILLPFNEEFILDIEDDKLFVKLPEGLLDL